MYKKIIAVLFFLTVSFLLVSCDDAVVSTQTQAVGETTTTIIETLEVTDIANAEISFENGVYEDYEEESYTIINGESESYEITVEGIYVLEGTITETVIINVVEDDDVTLVLNNVTITSSENQAILVLSADDVWISVPEGTSNYISDSSQYTEENIDLNATIYSEADLVINGSGYLSVDANYNNAIQTKDDLMICDVTLEVTSVDDGIIGRDSLLIQNATITLDTSGDSFKSTNEENTDDGYIYIESGVFNILTETDAFDAVNYIIILDGEFDIVAYSNAMKSNTDIYISGGTFNIQSGGDSISADQLVYILGGTFEISSGDDAIKGGEDIIIDGGDITILESYEGIEAPTITLNAGVITVTATDDGINAADGTGGEQGGTSQTSAAGTLYINGGLITVSADGDCLDVNGTFYMTNGELYAYGLSGAPDSAIDYNIACYISGGVIFGVGSSRMAMAPDESSEQASIMLVLSSDVSANSLVTITDSEDNQIFSATTQRSGDNIVISTGGLVVDDDYNVTVDGVMDLDFNLELNVTYLDENGITDELIEKNPAGGFPSDPGRR
jgi:hypothetical protein